ncbi:MAG: CehA/McbA family metallohydrolase [Armatimonadota bacterium]
MWIKGNLHTHTNLSDGDSGPTDVCRYYADQGYHFLSITDHGRCVDPAEVRCAGLLLIPGVELHSSSLDEPAAPLHVNGFGVTSFANFERGPTEATLQNLIDAVVGSGGIAQINHPNFGFAFDHTHMMQTRGARLLEVYNGHPAVYSEGDDEHIGVEGMWDHLLTAGMLIYGTAVDDAHHFTGDFQPNRANPSRGWVWTRVNSRTPNAYEVLRALVVGDFYATTGVELEDVFVDAWTLHVLARPDHITQFIGDGGEIVCESHASHSTFNLREAGRRRYIRAKVIGPDGSCAWCQPRLIPEFWRARV